MFRQWTRHGEVSWRHQLLSRRTAALGVITLTMLWSTPQAHADLWPVLDSHWTLDETDSGSTDVYDACGGVTGTRIGNVTIGVSGIDDTAYSFPGEQTSYVDLNRKDVLPASDPFKLELSINKPSSSPGNGLQYILSNQVAGETGRTILYDNGGRIILSNAGTNILFMDTSLLSTIRDDQWHTITITRQTHSDTLDLFELYIDDTLHDSETYSTSLLFESGGTRNWQLGGPAGVSSRAYTGLIDDVRVYVPEPSSSVLLLGAVFLLWRRNRRR